MSCTKPLPSGLTTKIARVFFAVVRYLLKAIFPLLPGVVAPALAIAAEAIAATAIAAENHLKAVTCAPSSPFSGDDVVGFDRR